MSLDKQEITGLQDAKSETFIGDGVVTEITKLGKNYRRIRSKIRIESNLETVWKVLTDYEKLVDLIPALTISQVIEKNGNCCRLYQMGQQDVFLGMKFKAKAVLDCYEKELEILPYGQKREIDFKMTEGDFQLFEGKWTLEQFNKEHEESINKQFQTTLSYLVDVKPKMWLPVGLVEGRLSNDIKTNLSCIREEAQRVIQSVIHDL